MKREPVPATSARRRARAGLAVALLVCAALPVLGGNLQHSDSDDKMMGKILVGLAGLLLFMLPYLAKGAFVRLGPRYLTAQTISGWRTVDLHRLARVGRYYVMNVRGGKDTDMLVLVDLDGVRLMVNADDDLDRVMKRALANHETDSLRISSAALARLGLPEPPGRYRTWRLPGGTSMTFVIFPLCFGLPALLAWVAYLVSAT
ncbi:hypothetical protein ACIA8G_23055 [Lentzea sp. NPDC051213]|uniref:hypothetical protein n=1 Tax=Lentzea sp. NPDC051213 TaxID=3364126 RepID=UPI0037B320E2